ncbi:MAG: DUF368 domain-containing protein [Defluviitaleaceae bacterium]|nr:DUF368 domain-containing protein [Defluviitaleaceae bacterium]
MQYLFLMLKGMVVGGSNVMPGVSGATLAVILRIYDKKINAINGLFSNPKESLKFLIPVMIGVGIGILMFGRIASVLLEHFSMQTGGFVAGLMAGSLPFIHTCARADKNESASDTRRLVFSGANAHWLFAVAGLAVIVFVSMFAPESTYSEIAGVTFNAALTAHLFIGGLFAAATMVIPGISGAMMLILFGLYPLAMFTLRQIGDYLMSPFDFALLGEILLVVVPLGVGIVAGILLGSKVVAMLLEKFRSATYFTILGLVFGTIFAVFNNPDTYESHAEITPFIVAATAITFALGAVTSLILGRGGAPSAQ